METPTMMQSTYGNAAAYSMFDNAVAAAVPFGEWNKVAKQPEADQMARLIREAAAKARIPQPVNQPQEEIPMSERRMVRVVMVDPHEDVPTDIALLYDSKEQFTDKTDQELFFDMPVAAILASHNEKRTKLVDKAVKERTQYLEPARIRDLKMLVVTLAKF